MKYLLYGAVFLASLVLRAQDHIPFEKEVKALVAHNDSLWDSSQETIVFTGSSSIRMWKDLQERFPERQVLNAGFGGSQANDLLYHLNALVITYKPKQIFIYEGDNDIAAKKKPKEIMITFGKIIQQLKQQIKGVELVLISAKPSIARWNLRGKYRRLNRKFQKLAQSDAHIQYADVWSIMLDGRKLRTDLFIEDGLHMNTEGYALWYKTLKPYLN